jgi:hypothetical protein
MKNKDLINLLEQFNPDNEVCIEIKECITNQFVDSTYDIGFEKNDYDQLVLVVSVEKGKFDNIKY